MRRFAPGTPPPLASHVDDRTGIAPTDWSRLGLLNASEQGIVLTDRRGHPLWMNAEARRLTEVDTTPPETGRDWLKSWPSGERANALAALKSARRGVPARFSAAYPTSTKPGAVWEVIITPDGPPIADRPTLTAFIKDVSERKSALEKLEWAATHDGLTGLPNRALFYDTLDRRLESAEVTGGTCALVAFDLDRFKQINERLGHAGGDALLRGFGARLANLVPAGGMAARFGGDEFVLLTEVGPGEDDARTLVESMLDRLKCAYPYDGRTIECTASAGIAIFPVAGRTADELYMNADIALLAGKAQDPGRAIMFSGDMRQELQRKASSLEVAAAAVANGWIEPHYQPKFDLATGDLCGLEALLRWKQPGGEWQSPHTIAAAFNDKCLATKITDTMIRQVVSDLNRWRRKGCATPVAINVSAADFLIDDFAERLLGQLAQGDVPPSLIELEVTEGVFLGDGAAHVARVLRKLSDAGVRIALDDFGTGYASLSHLKQFPVHVIKIDRSFVRSVTVSHEDRAIVRTMIDLGKSMSIEVVAEGIEYEAQLSFLKNAGCDVGQGFLFGKEMPATEIESRYARVHGAGETDVVADR